MTRHHPKVNRQTRRICQRRGHLPKRDKDANIICGRCLAVLRLKK